MSYGNKIKYIKKKKSKLFYTSDIYNVFTKYVIHGLVDE